MGLRVGGWVCLGFPPSWKNAHTPPGGGCPLCWVGGWVAEFGRIAKCICVFVAEFVCASTKNFHFSFYIVLELTLPGGVSDPVVIAAVSWIMGMGSNPVVHTTEIYSGVVNLNLFHPKLLCDPPLRVSGRWVGGSESGWVGQPKSREGQLTPPPPRYH